jgi:hypothetical protein
MNEIQDFINKNRLLTVLCGFWIVIANVLYFSNRESCNQFSEPSWVTLWRTLTLDNFDLYQRVSSQYFDQAGTLIVDRCVKLEYVLSGHFSMMFIPIVILCSIFLSIKWVRNSKSS